ncbi:MAG TPA: thermonuclease family protein [Ornithinicoccus sp.]|nr:thermonuclease family protein [Ornithinicoccus sp.]
MPSPSVRTIAEPAPPPSSVRRVILAVLAVFMLLAGCSSLAKPEVRDPGAPVAAADDADEQGAEARQADGSGEDDPSDGAEQDSGDRAEGGQGAEDRDPDSDDGSKPAAPAEWGPLYDVLGVSDGDTIKVSIDGVSERIRIIGIDAPELARDGQSAECFAQPSASEMQSLVQSQRVHLLADPTQADRDRYDRLLRHVVREGGGHVGLIMVSGGYAEEEQFAAPYEYQSDLVAAEQQARTDGLGLWSACLVAAAPVAPAPVPAPPPPPPPAAPADPAPAECVIKGNIASDGERIYHVPGQQYYDKTVITLSKGERWFCTEQDARDAGWRKAKI